MWSWTSTLEEEPVLRASALCFAVAFPTYAIVFHLRAASTLGLTPKEEGLAPPASAPSSTPRFVGTAFASWILLRALGNWVRGARASTDYLLITLFYAALFALLARNFAFTAMSFRGPFATAAAVTWGVSLIATLSGLALRAQAETKKPVVSGLRLFFSALSMPSAPRLARALSIVAILILAVRLQVVASRMDWNGLMQKLCACLSWSLVFAASLSIFVPQANAKSRTIILLFVACSGAVTYRTWRTFGHPADMAPALDKLAVAEPSFGFLYDLAGSHAKRGSMGEVFDFMQRNTSFGQERHIEPLDVTFANDLGHDPRAEARTSSSSSSTACAATTSSPFNPARYSPRRSRSSPSRATSSRTPSPITARRGSPSRRSGSAG